MGLALAQTIVRRRQNSAMSHPLGPLQVTKPFLGPTKMGTQQKIIIKFNIFKYSDFSFKLLYFMV